MNRLLFLALLTFMLTAPSWVMAQGTYNHGEVGTFADYTRLSAPTPDINMVGLGGRVGFNLNRHVQLEGEMNYDFKRNFTTTFTNGITTQLVTTRFRPLTGLFGPKFQAGSSGPFRAFITGKVGFINFSTSSQNAPAGFTSAIEGITTGDTRVALYPGGGVEGFWGPFGLRLDVGDEIYFANGTQHNLRVTFGPHLRF